MDFFKTKQEDFMKLLLALCLLAAPLAAQITPDAALQRLADGNDRYTKDQFISPDRTQERREEVVNMQKPYAVIVGCSDSRVSPEIIFDQGIGDLFVVRVAGNVIGPVELDSIEYSVKVLNSVLVVVLGHENCGAVKAVLANQTKDIEAIAAIMEKAIAPVKDKPGDAVVNAVQANARAMAEDLKKVPNLAPLVKDGKLKIVPGYYNLQSGKVDILTDK